MSDFETINILSPSITDSLGTEIVPVFDHITGEVRKTTIQNTITDSVENIPSSASVVDYVDLRVAQLDAMIYKGVQDCSTNPNYPSADAGHTYRVSVDGKIGGASGVNVEAGDILICNTDGTVSGNQATVGTYWNIMQTNIDGATTASANFATDEIVLGAGANKTLKTSSKSFETTITNSDTKIPTSGAVVDYSLPLAGGIITGFTALGSDAPKIKMKTYSGTSASSQNGVITVAHGLTVSKIIGVFGYLNYTGSSYVGESHWYSVGYVFNITFDATNLTFANHPTQSANILSKAFKILVIYIE